MNTCNGDNEIKRKTEKFLKSKPLNKYIGMHETGYYFCVKNLFNCI